MTIQETVIIDVKQARSRRSLSAVEQHLWERIEQLGGQLPETGDNDARISNQCYNLGSAFRITLTSTGRAYSQLRIQFSNFHKKWDSRSTIDYVLEKV